MKVWHWIKRFTDVAKGPSVKISRHTMSVLKGFNCANVFELALEISGINEDDLKIKVIGDHLIIYTQNQYSSADHNSHWMWKEFGYSSFKRWYQLPSEVDPESVEAVWKDGLLVVTAGNSVNSKNGKGANLQ